MSEEKLATCLSLFKLDMGITHNLRDTLFTNLINSSTIELEKMGVNLSSGTVEDTQLIVDYSAWMYRKRQEDIGLPRNLQFRIHNRVIQKVGVFIDA
ncbi:hypothetical protein ACIQGW_15935 [Lysinibacillus xylanilyticus]|uniref:hypothetical protein n=1 Tax=Lysinibacillus xylanilyticus TaxID=582475 RepID=UPI00381855B2